MPDRHPVAALADAVRRQWWLVAVVTLAALAVGYLFARDLDTTYTASAKIGIVPAMTARAGIAKPDDMVFEVTESEEYRSIAASETGQPAETFASDTGAYTTGDPQVYLFVTYESADRERAESLVPGMARAAVLRARELSEFEIGKAREMVELTQGMVDMVERTEFKANSLRTQSEADLNKTQSLYTLRLSLVNYKAAYESALNAYTYNGNVTVEARAASEAVRDSLVGAGFVGLVVGVAVAAVRELTGRRGAASSAP